MARKLHEFLSAQTQFHGQAEKLRTDLHGAFTNKRHLFSETLKTYTPDGEDTKPVIESQSALTSTVPGELLWLAKALAKALDNEATIDNGNTVAKADVRLDNGEVILTAVPATQLLQLDKRLNELQQFAQAIPTLDPAKGFEPDKDRGRGIFVAREVTKRRTSKEQMPLVLAQATDRHPAQVQVITKDKEIGTIVEQEWSGLITPAIKAEILGRIEELRRAVKQARARANDVIVEPVNVGEKLLGYVFEPATR